MRMRSPRIAPPVYGLVGSTAIMPTVRSCLRYSRASWSTSVLLPAPGAPVSTITRACALKGNSAFSRSRASGRLSSMVLMARARARTSPERMRSTHDGMLSAANLILQQLPGDDQSLNFAGAFADGANLDVAINFFRRIILDKAVTAVDLHALIGT